MKLHAPLFPLALCLMAGIAAGRWLEDWTTGLAVLIPLVMVTSLLSRFPRCQTAALWTCMVVLGATLGTRVQHQDNRKVINQQSYHLRQLMTDRYRQWGISDEAIGVVAAMTLGEKSQLDKGLKDTYSKVGRIARPGIERTAPDDYLCLHLTLHSLAALPHGVAGGHHCGLVGLCLSGRHVTECGARGVHDQPLCLALAGLSGAHVCQHALAGCHRHAGGQPAVALRHQLPAVLYGCAGHPAVQSIVQPSDTPPHPAASPVAESLVGHDCRVTVCPTGDATSLPTTSDSSLLGFC